MQRTILAVTFLFLASCSGRQAGSACEANSSCSGGSVCADGTCQQLCNSDLACTDSCCGGGVCGASCNSRGVPQITQVNGTGSTDAQMGFGTNRVQDTLVIEGVNLEGAEIQIANTNGVSQTLLACGDAPTNTRLEVQLPQDFVAGAYTLTAVNQSGQCSAAVTMLRGEDGEAGINGASCTVSQTTSGATITCDGNAANIANGQPGPGMPSCSENGLAAADGSGGFACRNSVTLNGTVLRLPNNNIAAGTDDGALIIGTSPSANRMTFDDNEIQAKDAADAGRTISINNRGGDVNLAAGALIAGADGTVSAGTISTPAVQLSGFVAYNNFGSVPAFDNTPRKFSYTTGSCSAETRGRIRAHSLLLGTNNNDKIDVLCFCSERVSGGTETYRFVCNY